MFDDFDTQITPEELAEMAFFFEEIDEEGYVEFEPGKYIWDEMAANP